MKRGRNTFKACVALLLSFALCVPGVAYTGAVQTVEAVTTTGTTEDGLSYKVDMENSCVTITDYTGGATEVVIPSEIDGYPVTSIGYDAFRDCSSLTSIKIPEGVTSIGYYAFYRCSSLTSITIPDSVTSIGDDAFAVCSSLTSITIPDSVTSIGSNAFSYCYALTSITIPDSVTEIGEDAFVGCGNLTIYCTEGSAIYAYAVANQVKYSFGVVPTTVYGDLDGNNSVDASDALAVLRAVVKLTTLTDAQTTAADVDGDDAVAATDALLILKHVVKLIDTFPVETVQQ